jgi:hypothetical protein
LFFSGLSFFQKQMLALFRTNQIGAVVPLALYVALLHLPAYMGWLVPSAASAPKPAEGLLYAWGFGWLVVQPFWSAVVAALLVFLQAVLVNWICNESRIAHERNWLPAVLYVLVASSITDFQFVSPPLVAVTFVLLAIRKVFLTYKSGDTTLILFDSGLFVALGGLFYPMCMWVLLALYLGIAQMRAFRLREQAVFLTGAFTPGFLAWTWSFCQDQGALFRHRHLFSLFQWWGFRLDQSPATLLSAGILALMGAVVLLGYGSYVSKKLMNVQKYIGVLYWLMLVVVLSFLLIRQPQAEHFLLAAPAVGIFLGMTFQSARNPLLAELLHLLLLAGLGAAMWYGAVSGSGGL